jgi:hypothetical protein
MAQKLAADGVTPLHDFTIIAQVARPNVKSAIDVSEELVGHGYVDEARVAADYNVATDVLDAHMIELEEFDWDGALAALGEAHAALVNLWNAVSTRGHYGNPSTTKVEIMQRIVSEMNDDYKRGKAIFGGSR